MTQKDQTMYPVVTEWLRQLDSQETNPMFCLTVNMRKAIISCWREVSQRPDLSAKQKAELDYMAGQYIKKPIQIKKQPNTLPPTSVNQGNEARGE